MVKNRSGAFERCFAPVVFSRPSPAAPKGRVPYGRHPDTPEEGINSMNILARGLLACFFGGTIAPFASAATLDSVRERGFVNCGVGENFAAVRHAGLAFLSARGSVRGLDRERQEAGHVVDDREVVDVRGLVDPEVPVADQRTGGVGHPVIDAEDDVPNLRSYERGERGVAA